MKLSEAKWIENFKGETIENLEEIKIHMEDDIALSIELEINDPNHLFIKVIPEDNGKIYVVHYRAVDTWKIGDTQTTKTTGWYKNFDSFIENWGKAIVSKYKRTSRLTKIA